MAIFTKTLNATDFGITATATDVTLTPNKWVIVASYTVPAQQQIQVGITEMVGGGPQGRVAYIRLDDTAGAQLAVEQFRVTVQDANAINTQQIDIDTGNRWAGSSTDRQLAKLLPVTPIIADEDSRINIEVYNTKANAVFDMSDADNAVYLPVTVRTGADRVAPRK